MKHFRYPGLIALTFVISLIGYESFAVIQAKQKTPEIFNRLLSRQNVTLRLTDIPKDKIHQLLLVEDPNFYQHRGVDFYTPGAGLTTISQAMAKYLYFDHFEPGFMKLEQTLIAWLAINALVNKDDQLTVFINTAYFGTYENKEVRGFAMAARAYYGKHFNELTDDEYLSLVAMLIGPNEFNIKYQPDKNRERVGRIKNVLSGKYKPHGLRDVYYGHGA